MELRTACERCHSALAPEGSAYFCSHECTFCPTCARGLEFVCPNCGGELVRRPRRGSEPRGAAPGPPRDLTIRRATAKDVPDVAPLFDAYRQFYGQPTDPVAAERFLTERLARGESTVRVAEREGRAVGFTQLYPSFTSITLGPIYVLNDLFVDPAARHAGVASALLRDARDGARSVGAHYLELSTAVDNPAQRVYEAEGWRLDREFLHYELPLRGVPPHDTGRPK
jgi:hypothetical protein